MADGRHLKKSKTPHLRNGSIDLHKIWYGDAFWTSEGYGQLKFSTFKNTRWRTAAILKNRQTALSPQWFDRSAQNVAWWRILNFDPPKGKA